MQSTAEEKFIHSKHSTCSSYFIKQIQMQRLTQEILILKGACPATSYVIAMFHPTIGQCAHQSLSNISTPELFMIPTRNKGTLADSHIANDTTKNQPRQHCWVYQAAKEMKMMTAKIVSSTPELWTPTPDLA